MYKTSIWKERCLKFYCSVGPSFHFMSNKGNFLIFLTVQFSTFHKITNTTYIKKRDTFPSEQMTRMACKDLKYILLLFNTFIHPGTIQFSTRLVFVVIQHQFQILQYFKRYSLLNTVMTYTSIFFKDMLQILLSYKCSLHNSINQKEFYISAKVTEVMVKENQKKHIFVYFPVE